MKQPSFISISKNERVINQYKQNIHVPISIVMSVTRTTLMTRSQHWALLGPTGPRWAPCWPHELCYLGGKSNHSLKVGVTMVAAHCCWMELCCSLRKWQPQVRWANRDNWGDCFLSFQRKGHYQIMAVFASMLLILWYRPQILGAWFLTWFHMWSNSS